MCLGMRRLAKSPHHIWHQLSNLQAALGSNSAGARRWVCFRGKVVTSIRLWGSHFLALGFIFLTTKCQGVYSVLPNTFIRGRLRASAESQTCLSIRENCTLRKCPFCTPYQWGTDFLNPDINSLVTPGILVQHPHLPGKFYGPKEKGGTEELSDNNN